VADRMNFKTYLAKEEAPLKGSLYPSNYELLRVASIHPFAATTSASDPREAAAQERDLAGEIATYLETHRPARVAVIARAVEARDADVRHILTTNDRFRLHERKGRANLYTLAPKSSHLVPVGGTGA